MVDVAEMIKSCLQRNSKFIEKNHLPYYTLNELRVPAKLFDIIATVRKIELSSS